LHGFLILDKPAGISSAKAVGEVKRLLACKKIGHGGTLDPLASGILPLAIGEATKAFDYIASAVKQYRFTVTFGEERSTDDAEGNITAATTNLPTREDIIRILPQFIGHVMQMPPVYSALKIDGKRAYARARAGEQVEMTARMVEIFALEMEESCELQVASCMDISPATRNLQHATIAFTFAVTCGKGTYVRSLARDIARSCNSLGYVSMLRRTAVGVFKENKAISLDKLAGLVHNAALFEAWVSIELALDDIPAIDVNALQAGKLRHGQSIGVVIPEGKVMALHQGRIVALAESLHGMLRPVRVFNLD